MILVWALANLKSISHLISFMKKNLSAFLFMSLLVISFRWHVLSPCKDNFSLNWYYFQTFVAKTHFQLFLVEKTFVSSSGSFCFFVFCSRFLLFAHLSITLHNCFFFNSVLNCKIESVKHNLLQIKNVQIKFFSHSIQNDLY